VLSAPRVERAALCVPQVLPEAFDQGGDVVGLSCLLGFMAAIAVKSVGMQFDASDASAALSNNTSASL